jgi:hypothetical protein
VAALSGEDLQDLVEDGAEIEVQEAVGFVHDEVLQVAQREALCVFEMIQKSSWRRHHDMRLLSQLNGLRNQVHSTHENGASYIYQRPQRLELLRDLVRKLSRRSQHQAEQRLRFIHERLQYRQRKRSRLARARLC